MDDEAFLQNDSKYRQYVAAVDKALKNFEYSSEWADLISCLGKLNKTIQAYPKYHNIPKKLFVGKRLAQCLHPALPSGVHLKALETYDLIFRQIGPKRLAQDLFIFSAGIFPLLSQAAISVKPVLFDIYENHFLPLGKRLLPGLPGLVLALLPGIEEASEHTGRTTELLQRLCESTDRGCFFSAIWHCVLYSSSMRLAALTFTVNQLCSSSSEAAEEYSYIAGNDKGLLVKALCGALDDANVLVQRMTLEFLIAYLPIHTSLIEPFKLMTILMFSLSVVLRRDMSLNRRLFQWLLSSSPSNSELQRAGSISSVEGQNEEEMVEALDYFQQKSKDLVVAALISLFQTSKIDKPPSVSYDKSSLSSRKKHDELKPFRILISLLDKPEIGSAILEDVLLEVFRTLYQNCMVAASENLFSKESSSSKWKPKKGIHEELVKTANLLFNAFEPYFMWDFLSKCLAKCKPNAADSSDPSSGETISTGLRWNRLVHTETLTYAELFLLIDFLLDVVSLEASLETQSEHWPDLLNQLILETAEHLEVISLEDIKRGTQLASKLLSKISPPMRPLQRSETTVSHKSFLDEVGKGRSVESDIETTPSSPDALSARLENPQYRNEPGKENMPAMQKCIKNTKLLFLKFVDGRVVPMLAHDTHFVCSKRCVSCESRYFRQVLHKSSDMCGLRTLSSTVSDHELKCEDVSSLVGYGADNKFDEKHDAELCCKTFLSLCRFLVELSCFPFLVDSLNKSATTIEKDVKSEEWVESLIVCCCQEDNFNIQSTAICTLLDLVNVSMSLFPSYDVEAYQPTSPKAIPLISWNCTRTLEQSDLYERLAKSLWMQITSSNTSLHRSCVELFLQLHNLTPSLATCEDVISKTLVHPDLGLKEKAFWRFGILWHLSRGFYKNADNSRSSRGPVRTFDRCLLLMLDGLNSECPKIRFHVTDWLQHAIHYGDIGRIIEPLLLVLLDPSSSRVGVHYVDQVIKRNLADMSSSVAQDDGLGNLPSLGDPSLSDSDSDKAFDLTSGSVVSDSFETMSADIKTQKTTELKDGQEAESGFADDEGEDEEGGKRKNLRKLDRRSKDIDKDGKDAKTKGCKDGADSKTQSQSQIHPLLVHKLYYLQHLDTQQTLRALEVLLAILRTDGRAFVCSALTASMSMCSTPHQSSLRELLIRHRKAITGRQFFGSLSDSHQLLVRASTAKYLEILLTVCLYFVRCGYHPTVPTTDWDLEGNLRVQVLSVELLTDIMKTMRKIASDSGSGFSDFVSDILTRCKVQRIVLHCLLSTVYTLLDDTDSEESWSPRGMSSSTEGSKGNQSVAIKTAQGISTSQLTRSQTEDCVQKICLQKAMLRLCEELMFLEDTLVASESKSNDGKPKEKASKKQIQVGSSSMFEYLPSHSLAIQPMFLSVVLSTLKEQDWLFLHHRWISMIINSLPKLNEALPKIVVPVVDQICLNLRAVSNVYTKQIEKKCGESSLLVPPDYVLTLLEDLTAICHFCLIDVNALQPMISTAPKATVSAQNRKRGLEDEEAVNSGNSLQIFSNLIHVFSIQSAPVKKQNSEEVYQPLIEAREGLLSILPTILASLVGIWLSWVPNNDLPSRDDLSLASQKPLPLGLPKSVRQSVLQFLTPVAMNHTIVFLASTADVWNQSKPKEVGQSKQPVYKKGKEWLYLANKKILPILSQEQEALIDIIASIKVLTLENIVETIRQVLRQMLTNKEKQKMTHALEVNLLQFLFEVLQKRTADEVAQVKGPLMTLTKDGFQLNLPPPALFVFLSIFSKFIHRVPAPEDRRARRELQDIAQRLVDGCNAIAAASLESSAWFRRSLMVIPQADQSVDMDDSSQSDRISVSESTQGLTAVSTKNAQYSVQALCILAEILAPMLDLLYVSEEKDRVASIVVNVMYNVVPYLKNHSPSNVSGFRACSAFLAAISDYQYTLRAWKKEVYDLFLDADFFTLDPMCIPFWRAVIDRLMTYDATLFKDLMTKIAMAQSGTINIFANREQEMEQRAQLLKRLSFTIFCGEVDQYHGSLPDIQERLAESFRQLLVPVLHEQVFLCFRVLLLRMSPHHLVSLWPHIITEMVVVFSHMEEDLLDNGNETTKQSRIGSMESFFGLNGVAQKTEKWLALYLAACKMLDFAISLPSDSIPQFQAYKWAFVDSPGILRPELDVDLSCSNRDVEQEVKRGKKVAKKRNPREDSTKQAVSKMAVLNAPLATRTSKPSKQVSKQDNDRSQKSQEADKVGGVSNTSQLAASFVPYLSRLTSLLLRLHKEESLACLTRKPGQPVITISRIRSVEELLPFLLSVTGKGASFHSENANIKPPKLDHFEKLVERDFIHTASTD